MYQPSAAKLHILIARQRKLGTGRVEVITDRADKPIGRSTPYSGGRNPCEDHVVATVDSFIPLVVATPAPLAGRWWP
jgi:hypothetical protein